MSRKKETNYFYGHYAGIDMTSEEYLENFAAGASTPVLLEASPCYFMGGGEMAQSIKDTLGEAKIVAILREPVERYLSLCQHIVNKRNVGVALDLNEFTQQCMSFDRRGFQGLQDLNHMSFVEGCYRELLDEWLSVMGPDSIHVTFYDKLFCAESQRDELESLMSWLGMPDSDLIARSISLENIGRPQPKSEILQKLALGVNDKLEPVLNRFGLLRSMIRGIYYSMNTTGADKFPNLKTPVISTLRATYADKNRGLACTLDKLGVQHFPNWIDENQQ